MEVLNLTPGNTTGGSVSRDSDLFGVFIVHTTLASRLSTAPGEGSVYLSSLPSELGGADGRNSNSASGVARSVRVTFSPFLSGEKGGK